MDLSFLTKFVDASKLGGWVRAGVGALIVWAIAKWPALNDVVGDQATQTEIAVGVSAIVVGVWSHIAKSAAAGQVNVADTAKKTTPLIVGFLLCGMMLGSLGACSSQTAQNVISAANTYDNAVQNFNAAVAAINNSIALTSTTVGPYCSAAQSAGQNLVSIASGNATAVTALNTTAAALKTYCNALPTDIQTAIVQLTAAAAAAKAAAQGG